MRLTVEIRESEQGGYVAFCPSLPGCVTRGQTREEVRQNIQDAIRGYLASINNFVSEVDTEELVMA
jgi:predicted RNase H-like HicB family nuclease